MSRICKILRRASLLSLCFSVVSLPYANVLAEPGEIESRLTPEEQFEQIRAMVANIQPGMTRGRVRRLLTEDGGLQSLPLTRYYPDYSKSKEMVTLGTIHIPFDNTGGNFSARNRVNGPVQLDRDFKFEKELERIKAIVTQIRFGMTRAEVEQLLSTDGHHAGSVTYYPTQHSSIEVKVPFDNSGGIAVRTNRVSGTVTIERLYFHSD